MQFIVTVFGRLFAETGGSEVTTRRLPRNAQLLAPYSASPN